MTARIVEAGTDDDDPATVGIFLVDLETPCIERHAGFEALGMRGSASGRLVLNGALVPGDALVVRRPAGGPDPRGPAPGAWFAMALRRNVSRGGGGCRIGGRSLGARPQARGRVRPRSRTYQAFGLRLGRLDAALRVARIVTFDAAPRWDDATDRDGRLAVLPDITLAKVTATNAAGSPPPTRH